MCTVQVNFALGYVDNTMESLYACLKERGVDECVNAIIIVDHDIATNKLVHLMEVSWCDTVQWYYMKLQVEIVNQPPCS